ncbi:MULTISPECIES: transglutaminase-like domain-containing protein [Pseudomonas]|uniref:transglutaminase-like domain-containing protein n=1 Tax=Pseudomonas TaxID=286 RepID=UPI00093EACDA|nr:MULTISPECIES: transglutaminase-like domain-containing protein [Pseudomonas]MDH0639333.1 transglutaminase-like domain-containing protein [Pseudomonas sp. GD03860]
MNEDYLLPGRFVESDDAQVIEYVRTVTGCRGATQTPLESVVRLYYAVRDDFVYDPYDDFNDIQVFSGKRVLQRGRGFCISKAALLAAGCRVLGVPARLGFADVRNHLASPRIREMNNGDIFRWHSYAEILLDGKWVKATPAFDLALCRKTSTQPLEFDGLSDSIFHEYDSAQRRHMEYVTDHGVFSDVPAEAVLASFRKHCSRVFDRSFSTATNSFIDEVQTRT